MLVEVKRRLEIDDNPIEAIKWKIEQTKEKNLPMERVADYVADTLISFDTRAKEIDNEIAFLREKKQEMKHKKQKVSEGVATFFLENGLEKFEGMKISSLTVTQAKEATTKTTKKFETPLTTSEIEEFLIMHGKGKIVEVTTQTKPTNATIRINKRRAN